MLRLLFVSGLTAASLSYLLVPSPAHACGGCFAPTSQPSVVTAHRMVVSISDEQTTLWDQFEYAGDPEDFVWVLPVTSGAAATIAVSQQSFFRYLADWTAVRLQGPIVTGTSCLFGGGDYPTAPTESDARGVTVYASEVVGPYETVTIGASDAASLTDWLTENGYAVPAAMEPTIAHYVAEGMDFVVLRLSPNAGVSQMQPVRVTTPGANVVFPLRMVAAGVADTVSLELFVIGHGRYEVQNFPNAQVNPDNLFYDAEAESTNYDEIVAGLLAANRGRTWVTEHSERISAPQSDAYYMENESYFIADGIPSYMGALVEWQVATRSVPGTTVTRMRAELPVDALGDDLVLRASERAPFPNFYQVQTAGRLGSTTSPSGKSAPMLLPFLIALGAGLIARSNRRRWRSSANQT